MAGEMQRFPVGVVQKDGDTYIGCCDEVGTTSVGRTVEEAFSNLRMATWRELQRVEAVAMDAGGKRAAERRAA